MQILNHELRALLKRLSEDERRLAELFTQALGEYHVLNVIIKNSNLFFLDGKIEKRKVKLDLQ